MSVNAYGYCDGITFPLKLKIFKPKERLKEEDEYKTKPELAAEIIKELQESGFNIRTVVADSLYGESHSNFVSILEDLGIEYAVGIRSNHRVWLPKEAKVRVNKWKKFEHIIWDKREEDRYIREIIYGKKVKQDTGKLKQKKALPTLGLKMYSNIRFGGVLSTESLVAKDISGFYHPILGRAQKKRKRKNKKDGL